MAIIILHIPTGKEIIVPGRPILKPRDVCHSAIETHRCEFKGVCKFCIWDSFTLDNPEFLYYHKDIDV